jgi:hypothetical protein
LEWLLEHEDRVAADPDFHKLRRDKTVNTEASMTTCIYMVIFNQKALAELLHVWLLYKTKKRMPPGFSAWTAVFRCLRSIRRWGPVDRLREADLLRNALEPINPSRMVPVEIELWCRSAERRRGAEARIHQIVELHQGKVLDRLQLQEIHYHAMLVEVPHAYLEQILNVPDVDLVQVDDIYLLRPVSQCAVVVDTTHRGPASAFVQPRPSGTPICALLDGLPMENHPHLVGRVLVDDPDGWASTYMVHERKHGTAMASLIVHGDLASEEAPIARPLYVRPILNLQDGSEESPRHRLWLDVIHTAVRRMVVQEGATTPVAPSVRVVNLSVGDRARPFLREPSPVARLLDWLAWQYKLLFIVSAGNQDHAIPASAVVDDSELLRHQLSEIRHRRLLSPAETLNGLTIGSLNQDQAVPVPPSIPARAFPHRTDVPAAYSAFGRGLRQAVKPDFLVPGGRRLFRQRLPMNDSVWEPLREQSTVGHTVAVPGPSGERQVSKMVGTSNSAALASRTATQINEVLEDLLRGPDGAWLSSIPMAILLKAMLVHTADWPPESTAFVLNVVKPNAPQGQERDYASSVLGYGVLRPSRGLGCDATRATAIGGGIIEKGRAFCHQFPLPDCLHTRREKRRLTATLAWFSPINPTARKYRVARLGMQLAKGSSSPLLVESCQVHADATGRGTVQHIVLEQEDAAMNIGPVVTFPITVSCEEDAGGLNVPIHYALAVTLEVAPGLGIPLYEQVAQRLRTRRPVPVPP